MFNKEIVDKAINFANESNPNVPHTLKIEKGKWYMCVEDYTFRGADEPVFEKGKVYLSEKNEELTASNGEKWPFGNAKDYFRPATEDEIPIENIYEPFKVYVLTFSKRYYDRNSLENLSDIEKYNLANGDRMNCAIYDSTEYTNLLNEYRLMDRYVYTYIVVCTQMSIVN